MTVWVGAGLISRGRVRAVRRPCAEWERVPGEGEFARRGRDPGGAVFGAVGSGRGGATGAWAGGGGGGRGAGRKTGGGGGGWGGWGFCGGCGMAGRVACDCGKTYAWSGEGAGRRAKCKGCGAVVNFPDAEPGDGEMVGPEVEYEMTP